jgi:glycosyltransferase involved in cell wall biosynthesis
LSSTDIASSRSVAATSMLFLEKVFLEPCRSEPRGVELFNFNLLRDLSRLGRPVTVVAHPSWSPILNDRLGADAPEVLSFPTWMKGAPGSVLALYRARHRRFSRLLTAKVGDRLIPALFLVRHYGLAPRAVLLAHREPTIRFVRAQGALPTTVAAVNRKIARYFEGLHYGRVEVYYGITQAERFLEPRPVKAGGEPVDFCVVGDLNSAWKGADTAVEAFRMLAPEVAARCRLHLASFREQRTGSDPRIVCYRWMPFDEIAPFVRRMDVMLVPSRDEGVMRETFSQAAVQGMLSGLPLIVSDLPILTEKVNEGGGVVAHSTEEMAAAMTRLAKDAALRHRMGQQARITAQARYIWSTEAFLKRFA